MIALLIIFSQHLKHLKIQKFPLFQVFPVLLSLTIVWGACAILTVTDILPEGDPARADSKLRILQGSPWFRVPTPFQWGWPTVSIGAVIGVLCGVLTSTIESIGDYYACAIIASEYGFLDCIFQLKFENVFILRNPPSTHPRNEQRNFH